MTAAIQQANGKFLNTLQLHLHNPRSTVQNFTVADNSYGARPITKTLPPDTMQTVAVTLQSSHNWYDLTIRVADSKASVHLARRIETGTVTRTDPLMGNARSLSRFATAGEL